MCDQSVTTVQYSVCNGVSLIPRLHPAFQCIRVCEKNRGAWYAKGHEKRYSYVTLNERIHEVKAKPVRSLLAHVNVV